MQHSGTRGLDSRGKVKQSNGMRRSAVSAKALVVSSKGRVVLPVEPRKRHGVTAGVKLDLREGVDGLRLRVLPPVLDSDLVGLAGMVEAPVRGVPRRLEDFDSTTALQQSTAAGPRARRR